MIADKSWMSLGSLLSDNQCRIAAHTLSYTMHHNAVSENNIADISLFFWRCFHMFRTCCDAALSRQSSPKRAFFRIHLQTRKRFRKPCFEPLGSLNQLNPHAQNLGLDISCPWACQQSDVLHGPPVHGSMWMLCCLYCCCASDCSVASATSASCKHEAKHIGNQSNLMELVSAHVSILHFPSAEGTSFQMPRPQLIINSISKYLQITCHPTHCEVRIPTSITAISISHTPNISPETFASISSQLSTSCRRRLQTHSRIRDPP